jgi:dUTP pyrophosphatase
MTNPKESLAICAELKNYSLKALLVKRLSDSATIPTYGSEGAACFDLYADDTLAIAPGRAGTVKTSVSFAIPTGYVMLVFSRSGHGFKSGVRLANCTGVIDSDYKGEVMVRLKNEGSEAFMVRLGDRVAQAMLLPVERFELVDTDDIGTSERGTAGFGSTGK